MSRRLAAGSLALAGLAALLTSWLLGLSETLAPAVRTALYLVGVTALAAAFLLRPRGVR